MRNRQDFQLLRGGRVLRLQPQIQVDTNLSPSISTPLTEERCSFKLQAGRTSLPQCAPRLVAGGTSPLAADLQPDPSSLNSEIRAHQWAADANFDNGSFAESIAGGTS